MTKHFGLDIGSKTIKIVQLDQEGGRFKLVTAGMIKNPLLGFISADEKEMLPLAEAIKRLAAETKVSVKGAAISLPDRKVFTQIVEIPKMEEGELEQAIPMQAESLIPKPLSEINLDWEIIEDKELEKQNRMKILLVAAPSDLVKSYLNVLRIAGLEVSEVETEILALLRCLKPIFGQKSAAVFNLGDKSADIFIVKNSSLFASRSLPNAGESLTRAVSNALGLDLTTAEEYKKTYGLSADLEGKIASSIEPVLGSLANEVKKAISFFEREQNQQIKLLVLAGGESSLLGLSEYLAKSLGIEVQIANPFLFVDCDPQVLEMVKKDAVFYSVAVGLAMKGI